MAAATRKSRSARIRIINRAIVDNSWKSRDVQQVKSFKTSRKMDSIDASDQLGRRLRRCGTPKSFLNG
jgi:hypothetical protein